MYKDRFQVMKIAIQGIKASFHDVAARLFFAEEKIDPLECSTFRELCEVVKNKKAKFAMMAIENSIAGSILPNYSLLEGFQFQIVGEVYLRIEMSLMALPGQKMEDLKFVQSHPMALFQCEDFLHKYPKLEILEGTDTAESAKNIKDKNLLKYAAIASQLAAETYNLEVLESGIETNKQNYTRFLVISPHAQEVRGANKTSLRFQTPHSPGSLVNILKIFVNYNINMTKIQSVPILGRPYEYSFHVDLDWENRENYVNAFNELKRSAINLIHFGDYRRGDRPWT
jgi:prephenate dehydratase